MIYIYKTVIYFENEDNEMHRLNGPAYIEGGHKSWWKNGALHRLDGPALIYNISLYYYIEGDGYTESAYHEKLKEMGLKYDTHL